jgi:hypothetical protein
MAFEALASLVELVLIALLFPLALLLLGQAVALLVRISAPDRAQALTPMINWRVTPFTSRTEV